ncbi:MAG: hypothetical protein AAF725_06185 [Acidobacteriota bacterium]
MNSSPVCSGPSASVGSAVTFRQGDGSVPGSAETDDQFGAAVAYGRLRFPTRVDIVIGVPREDLESQGLGDTGCVYVFSGTVPPADCSFADSLSSQLLARPGQLTGSALASGRDWDLDGLDDLLVGIPGDDSGQSARSGSVVLVNGSRFGINFEGLFRLGNEATSFGNYGSSLAFVGSREEGLTQLDLLIGEPGYDDPVQDIDRSGRITSTFLPIGMIFGNGFESGDLSGWDLAVP